MQGGAENSEKRADGNRHAFFLQLRDFPRPLQHSVPVELDDARLKAHFAEGYMLDIVPVLVPRKVLAAEVVEKHRDGEPVLAFQYGFAVLPDFVCHRHSVLMD